ncbi:MAG: hypothetical protein CMI55_02935 [Parcubacteria group bacterium]|jgi:N,N'-diacetyllegionaminate synthase|nr:hypothetical protein [Parcubacteria group bacterium]|tara:strand:+ start:5218 stop:6984 length:1767 start_codon:yes stop_codon:yes gene_type:complete
MCQVEIIAEVANAHQGKPEIALQLAESAVQAGADSVKFQIYYAEEFIVKTHSRFDHFKKQSFTEDVWNDLLARVKMLGAKIYADVFGINALKTAKNNNIDGYKVHSSDLCNTKLLNILSQQEKKVFFATGGSTFLEISYALNVVNSIRNAKEIILLHGFQAYPTKIDDTCLSRLRLLKQIYGNIVSLGYMDHVDGDDIFSTILPLMAIPYGIKYLEKHVTLDRSARGVDYYSSLNPDEFSRFVRNVRVAETAIGMNPEKFSESERTYRAQTKKKWVAIKGLKPYEILQESDIEMKRADLNADTPEFEKIVGRRIISSLEEDEPLTNKHTDHKVMAVIVARLQSSRLPQKAILDINGLPAICHLFDRVQLALKKGYIDRVAFCTTNESEDEVLFKLAVSYSFRTYRGDTENVLSRMMLAVEGNPDFDVILRITGDDILVDPEYISKSIECHLANNAEYTDAKQLPSGTEVEVFSADTLRFLYKMSKDCNGSEYLTRYITDNKDQFKTASLVVPTKHNRDYRLTLDAEEDYNLIKDLLAYMHNCGKGHDYTMNDIVNYFEKYPEKLEINSKVKQRKEHVQVITEIDWSRK